MGGAWQPGSARAPTWWPARACRHPERAGDSGAAWRGIAPRKPRQAGLDERFNGPLCGERLNETLFRRRPMPAPTWSSVRVRTRLRPGLSLGRAGKRGHARRPHHVGGVGGPSGQSRIRPARAGAKQPFRSAPGPGPKWRPPGSPAGPPPVQTVDRAGRELWKPVRPRPAGRTAGPDPPRGRPSARG